MSELRRVGKYEIIGRIGAGAMGTVYRARDPLLEREVALKLILGDGDDETRARFEREAKILANISHANIVAIYEFGYHEEAPFIAMELLRGQDLDKAIRHTPSLTLKERIGAVRQVLAGLGRAHKAGVVHRDIKPANVFVTEDGVVKILDFGVARLTGGAMTTGKIVGSAFYMSPEQWTSEPVDGRSDLFSTGVMLYELLAGVRPFAGGTELATMKMTVNDEPDFALVRAPAFIPVLRKALAKEVMARYQSAADFAAAIESVGVEGLAPPAKALIHAAPTIDIPPPAVSRPEVWPRVFSSRLLLIAVLAVVILAGAGWAFYRYVLEPKNEPQQAATSTDSEGVTSKAPHPLLRQYDTVSRQTPYNLPPITAAQRECIDSALWGAVSLDGRLDVAFLRRLLNNCPATRERARPSVIIAGVQAQLDEEHRRGTCARLIPVLVDGRPGPRTSEAFHRYADCTKLTALPVEIETLGDYAALGAYLLHQRSRGAP